MVGSLLGANWPRDGSVFRAEPGTKSVRHGDFPAFALHSDGDAPVQRRGPRKVYSE